MFSDILPPEPHVIDQTITDTEASLRQYEDAEIESLQANLLWFQQQLEIVKQQKEEIENIRAERSKVQAQVDAFGQALALEVHKPSCRRLLS